MVELDQQLNVLQTYPLSKLRTFKALPNGDNLIFLGDKTLWVNSKGEKKAYLYTSSKMFRVGEKFFIYSLDGKKIYEFPLYPKAGWIGKSYTNAYMDRIPVFDNVSK